MKLFKLAWKNIWYKPLNALLSIILIAFGVGLLSILLIFQKQFAGEFEKNQAGIDMVIGAKGSPLQLILSSMFHVDSPTGNIKIGDGKFLFNPNHPLIELSVPLSIGDSYQSYRIIGTNEDIFQLYPASFKSGKIWSDNMEVVVGAAVAKELNLQLGDNFYSSHGFNHGDLEHDEGDPFTVKGILAFQGSVVDQLILCQTHDIWAVHSHEHGHHDHDHGHDHESSHQHQKTDENFQLVDFPEEEITSVLVRLKADKKRSVPAINMPRSINENTPLMAASPTYQLNKLISQVGSGLKSLMYLAVLIALISALSIFISMYNGLKERKQELAIMRVAGAKPNQLMFLLIVESIILAGVGAIVGFLLSRFGLFFIDKMINRQYKYTLNESLIYKEEVFLLIGVFVLAILAALIPAWMARSKNIHLE